MLFSPPLLRLLLKQADSSLSKIARRTFLSSQFSCRDDWQRRLDTPLFKKIVLEDFYYEIEGKYNQTKKISSLDVDLFTNAVTEGTYLDETHDLVHKLRLSENAIDILPSTQHCFIRAHMDFNRQDELVNILNDRLNYGIFADDYCCLLMMNEFITKGNYRDAAKIASMQMLQEDFSNIVISYMSLFACHNYLLNPVEWEKIEPVEVNEDEEETRVRVKYIRNPYFDEHFDLKEANHLIGKTFMTMKYFLDNDLTTSYDLLGAILFEKYKLAESKLQSLKEANRTVHKDILDLASEHLSKKLESADGDLKASIEKLKGSLENMGNESLALPEVEKRLKEEIIKHEPNLIQQQKNIYNEWIEKRDKMIAEALENSIRDKKLDELEKARIELARKEEELFFFEKEDEIELRIENKKVIYPRKWLGKKKKKRVETTEYVSPSKWGGRSGD